MSKHTSSRLILIVAILFSLIIDRSAMQVSRAAPGYQPVLPASLGEVEVTWNPATNTPSFLRGHMPLPVSPQSAQADVTGAALAFIDQYRALFGVTNVQSELMVVQSQVDELGLHHVTLQQVYQGVEVYNALMKVHMDLTDGKVLAVSSGFMPGVALPGIEPQTNAEAAIEFAQSLLPDGVLQTEPRLVVFPGYGSSRGALPPQLAWLVELYDESEPARNLYVVDALDGELLDIIEQIHTGKWMHTEQEPPPGDDVAPAGVESPDEVEIVGGKVVTDVNTYPWMTALYIDFDPSTSGAALCGGSLIYPRWVLTAAHCVVNEATGATVAPGNVQAVFGRLDLTSSEGVIITATRVITHPGYRHNATDFDIALIYLNAPSTQAILPRLATSQDAELFAPSQPATVLGWGKTSNLAPPSDTLRQVTLPIVSNTTCNISNPGQITDNMLCAGYLQGGKDACQGDSGGPLIVSDRDNRWLQVGIVSWGRFCALPLSYGVYTRVSQFNEWIRDQVADTICDDVSEIPQAECRSLALLYHRTNGSEWSNNDGWIHTTTPCTWQGITCSAGHVTEVRLSSNNLQGALPPELANLTHLTILDLSLNQIGGVIPGELSGLSTLKQLLLQGNQLSGSIPPTLGNLSNLEILNLSTNPLGGVIPPALGNLGALRRLELHQNQLIGSIPPKLGDLTHLEQLYLWGNQLRGYIPAELGNLTNLTVLNLGTNRLSGPIPATVGRLVNLTGLFLSGNELSGSLPPELGSLTQLERLFLNKNGLRGPLPSTLTNLPLQVFHFAETNICEPQDNALQNWLAGIPELTRTNYTCRTAQQAKRLATYSSEHSIALPGLLLRVDDDPPVGDEDVDKAHLFSGQVLVYFLTAHGRASYDDQGTTLTSSVHYGRNYGNAFWNGVGQTVYGDGFAVRDVVAHEWTHAVTQYTANLEYRWQSGALNESFSDIFGVMVDRGDWLLGEDLPPDVLGGREAIRDMEDPTRFGQPAHAKDWVATCSDNEGVHTNSGIFNKAFYNIATAKAVGLEKAERIFYRALTIYLQRTSSFADARAKVLQSTADLYGQNSAEYTAVVIGFNAVGMDGRWQPPSNNCSCGATVALAAESEGEGFLANLRAVRDQVFTQDPGRRWAQIYYDHQFEVAWRLVSDSQVRADAADGFRAFDPVFRALLGQETGGPVLLTPELIAAAERALMGVANSSSAAVHDDIVREWERVNPTRFVGWDVREVWAHLQREEQDGRIHLPLIQK